MTTLKELSEKLDNMKKEREEEQKNRKINGLKDHIKRNEQALKDCKKILDLILHCNICKDEFDLIDTIGQANKTYRLMVIDHDKHNEEKEIDD